MCKLTDQGHYPEVSPLVASSGIKPKAEVHYTSLTARRIRHTQIYTYTVAGYIALRKGMANHTLLKMAGDCSTTMCHYWKIVSTSQ